MDWHFFYTHTHVAHTLATLCGLIYHVLYWLLVVFRNLAPSNEIHLCSILYQIYWAAMLIVQPQLDHWTVGTFFGTIVYATGCISQDCNQ